MQVLDVLNIKGEKVGKIDLKPEIFEGEINPDVVYQDVRRILAAQREGTAATKTRKDVRGGGRKPWRQKGTGRARIGSIRAPHWRGGGVVFGPHPRDYSFSIPKKVAGLAVKSALRDKLKANSIIVIDELKVVNPKTKEVAAILKKLKLNNKKVIMLPDKKDEIFTLLCIKRQQIIRNAFNKFHIFKDILDELGIIRHCLIYCSPQQISNVQNKGVLFVVMTRGVHGDIFERKMEGIADCVLELEVLQKGSNFERFLAVKKMRNYAKKIGIARYVIDSDGFVLEMIERIM